MKKFILAAAALAAFSGVALADADSYTKSLISNGYGDGYFIAHTANAGAGVEAFSALPSGKVAVNNSVDFNRLFEKGGSYSWIN